MPTNLSLYPLDFNINSEEELSLAAAINRLKIVSRDTALRTVYALRMTGQKEASSENNTFTNLDFNGKKLIPPSEGTEKDWWNNPIFTGIPKAPTPITGASSTQVATVGYVDNVASGIIAGIPPSIPIGSVLPYSAASISDSNYVIANGQAISRTTYAAYFALVGTAYGTGNGTTTFNVPNLQQRVPVGVGAGYTIGSTGGAATHTLTLSEVPTHSHIVGDPGHVHPINDPGHNHSLSPYRQYAEGNGGNGNGAELTSIPGGSNIYPNTQRSTTGITTTLVTSNISLFNSGGGLSHNNMQPYIVLNYIVKVK